MLFEPRQRFLGDSAAGIRGVTFFGRMLAGWKCPLSLVRELSCGDLYGERRAIAREAERYNRVFWMFLAPAGIENKSRGVRCIPARVIAPGGVKHKLQARIVRGVSFCYGL